MYEKRISQAEPGLITKILDDSGSQGDCLQGTTDPKFVWTDRLDGNVTKELLARSTELSGDNAVIKARYYTYTIIYGSKPEVWGGGEMDIEETVKRYADAGNSMGLRGKMGGTDTKAAYEAAYSYLEKAVKSERFKNSFPPMLFHLSDSMSQTDALPIAEKIKQLQTKDGNVLIVNAYIGTETDLNYNGPEDFPGYVDVSEVGSDEDNIRMFSMSSVAPDTIRHNLVDDGIFPNLREGSRLFFDVRTKDMLKHVLQVVGSQGSRVDRSMR